MLISLVRQIHVRWNLRMDTSNLLRTLFGAGKVKSGYNLTLMSPHHASRALTFLAKHFLKADKSSARGGIVGS